MTAAVSTAGFRQRSMCRSRAMQSRHELCFQGENVRQLSIMFYGPSCCDRQGAWALRHLLNWVIACEGYVV